MFRSCITCWKAIPVTYISLQYASLPKTPLQPHPSHDGMHPWGPLHPHPPTLVWCTPCSNSPLQPHPSHDGMHPLTLSTPFAEDSFHTFIISPNIICNLCVSGWEFFGVDNTSTLLDISPSCCSCNGKPFPCCFLLPSCWRWPWIGTKTPAAVVLWEVAGLSCLNATQGKNPADTVCRGPTGCPCSLWCHRSASHHSRDAEHLPSSHMPPARTTETSVRNYKIMSLC